MRILCGGYYPCFFPDEESEAQDHRAHMERSKYKYMYDFSKAVPDYVTFTSVIIHHFFKGLLTFNWRDKKLLQEVFSFDVEAHTSILTKTILSGTILGNSK